MLSGHWISLKCGQSLPNKLGLAVRFAFKQSISRAEVTALRKHRSQAQASDLTGVA